MSSRSALVKTPVARALARLLPPTPAAVAELAQRVDRQRAAPLPDEVGRFLEALAASGPSTRIVVLGGAGRGVALWLARGSKRAALVVADPDKASLEAASAAHAGAALPNQVEWIEAAPRAAVDRIEGPFDLAAIVAPADEARRLVDLLLPNLAVGGALVVLGALRDFAGAAAELEAVERSALERLRPYVTIHPQLAACLLPLGDGILWGVKRRETIRELGGPY